MSTNDLFSEYFHQDSNQIAAFNKSPDKNVLQKDNRFISFSLPNLKRENMYGSVHYEIQKSPSGSLKVALAGNELIFIGNVKDFNRELIITLKVSRSIPVKDLKNTSVIGDLCTQFKQFLFGPELGTDIEVMESRLYDIKLNISEILDPKKLWKNLPSDPNGIYAKPDTAQKFENYPAMGKSIVAASIRGRSHAHVGSYREDHFDFTSYDDWLCTVVADGAGSCQFSREGSKMACEKIITSLPEYTNFFNKLAKKYIAFNTTNTSCIEDVTLDANVDATEVSDHKKEDPLLPKTDSLSTPLNETSLDLVALNQTTANSCVTEVASITLSEPQPASIQTDLVSAEGTESVPYEEDKERVSNTIALGRTTTADISLSVASVVTAESEIVDKAPSETTPKRGAFIKEVIDKLNMEISKASSPKEVEILLKKLLGRLAYYVAADIKDRAKVDQKLMKDYSTTLLFCLAKKVEGYWFIATFWVGDGAVVLIENNQATLLGEPDEGEFSGQTQFITSREILTKINTDPTNSRYSFKVLKDFQAIMLMTDGITDPCFETTANLHSSDRWMDYFQKLENNVHLSNRNESTTSALMDSISFYSKGNHDDRTLAIIY